MMQAGSTLLNRLLVVVVSSLGHHRTGSGGLVLPIGRQLTGGSVVAGETVDAALDQNESEFAILVFAVALQVLAHLHRLFDEHVQVLRYVGRQAVGFEDAHNLLARDALDLSNTFLITENDTNLRREETFLGELADLLLDVGGRHFEPTGGSAFVRQSATGNALSWCVHATHDGTDSGQSSREGTERVQASVQM